MNSTPFRSDNKHDETGDSSTDGHDFQALILDCDGVMVDSEPLSCGAWNVVFSKEFNIDIGTDYSQILGKNGSDAATYYLERHGIPISAELVRRLVQLKERTYFDLARGSLKPMKGIRQVIQQARKRGWPVAVASSGTMKKIEFNLKQVGLYDLVDVIVGAEGKIRGKPFPDVFLEAAIRIGADPCRCVVIEDTPSGISSAKKAGMFVIALAKTFATRELHEADAIINDLSEVDFDKLRQNETMK